MSQFKPDQTLEQRMKQISIMEVGMNIGWLIFLSLALFNYFKPEALFGGRWISYILAGVVILQIITWKLFIGPMLRRKAQINLPEKE